MAQPTRTRIQATDYFQLPEYDQHDLIQLIDGEVIIGRPAVPNHQAIVREILVLFALTARKTGGKAYASPIEVYLDSDNVYEPDVLYLAPDSACVIGDQRLTGAPDLVVEVLSPGTARYDRQAKYQAYEAGGVNEYWVVDPVYEVIEVWRRGDDNSFKRQGAFAGDDTFESVALDESVSVKAIFTI